MTTPPRMPVRGQNSAPKFEGTPASLNRFFTDFEYLATISGLGEPEMKQNIVRYLSTEEADFWKQQPEWQSNATWLEFKTVIFKAYPGSEATDRTRISDMDALVGATQRIGIHTLAEFSEFYRKFSTIVVYLQAQNRIGNREISTNFLRALPADLQHKIIFRIQIKEPDRHVDTPHDLKSLFDAGVHVLHGSTILDTLNPYAAAAAYAQPNLTQQPGTIPPGYPHDAYNPSASTPFGYQPPPAAPGARYNPFVQATVPVTPQPPPGGSAYQPLAYGPGLKTEDILTIATTVASEFAKQLTPLFQQQSRGNAAPNSGQNRGTFTCAFCGQPGHGIRDCAVAQTYVNENRIRRDNGKLVMADGSQISRSRAGELLKDCVDRLQQVRTSALYEIVSPDAQESLDEQNTSQVNIQTYAATESEDEEERNAGIEAYELAIYELRQKKKQRFDGVEMPPRNKGKAPANAAASSSTAPAAPKPTAPAQPAPAIIPKPSKPFVPTTNQPTTQPPQEPNFRYAAPIEDRAVGAALFNRMLDAPITTTAREILATAPEVRKNFKDATTTRKVPTAGNPAKAYVDTNLRSANQVQLLCHEVHRELIVAMESHTLRAITPKIEGLHEVECLLDSGSQIVSISEAVWRTLNRELNPNWVITMQSANGSRNASLGIIENLELEIGGMKLHVQAHVIRNPAYDVLLGRPFDVLTASQIKNYRDETQTLTLTDPNSGKVVTLPTKPRGRPSYKNPPPQNMNEESSF